MPDSVSKPKRIRFIFLTRRPITTRNSNFTVSQKSCAKLFLPELHKISTNFDNFWQKDDKEAKIMLDALIFYLN